MAVTLPPHLLERRPERLAPAAGLRCTPDDQPGITRRVRGRGFQFIDPAGATVDGDDRERLLALAVPPAWTEVWLCPDPDGHLQASGRDDAGRKQYRYHDAFRAFCDGRKFERLRYFPRALRLLRKDVANGLRTPVGHRRFATSAALSLLDHGLLRVGNDGSAADGAHGATTLELDHLDLDDDAVRLEFTGKGGSERSIVIDDPHVMMTLGRLAEAAEDRLFWFDSAQGRRTVAAADCNERIAEVAGTGFSAKDFRTWGGTVLAVEARLDGASVLEAVDAAAEELGNTRAVARASYVHPLALEISAEELQRQHAGSRSGRWMSRAESVTEKMLTPESVRAAA